MVSRGGTTSAIQETEAWAVLPAASVAVATSECVT